MERGFPTKENPEQAAVDAELAKFQAEWDKKHPRQLVDLDNNDGSDPSLYGGGGGGGFGDWNSRGRYADNRQRQSREYSYAKKDFIRTNPIIQDALRREAQRKAQEIRDAEARRALAVLVIAAANQKLNTAECGRPM